MRHIRIRAKSDGSVVLNRVGWCADFWCKLRGLQFRRALLPGEAILLVEDRDSVVLTAIHMFFVNFDLGVVWINAAGRVVDKVRARPWRPSYAAGAPARYVLETTPDFLEKVTIGDEWILEDLAAGPGVEPGLSEPA
ncbi:MAG TPA: DUF192 domain-containing protein [Anaerolineales bacterium]|nr:DUF192 domain-containing protein [Anaerolineales bacterium]